MAERAGEWVNRRIPSLGLTAAGEDRRQRPRRASSSQPPTGRQMPAVTAPPEIDLTVYPDECDSFGHLNQASFLSLFERARWEMLARGPGMDIFTRHATWPAVRRAVIDYHVAAYPGDVLRFHQALTHHGRTSFTMRQTARRMRDDALISTAEFVFVCINREGRPAPVPAEFGE